MQEIKVKVEGGIIVATESPDEEYPGIDVEFVSDDDTGEKASRFRVLFEKPKGQKLRVLIWEFDSCEDYTTEITFNEQQGG